MYRYEKQGREEGRGRKWGEEKQSVLKAAVEHRLGAGDYVGLLVYTRGRASLFSSRVTDSQTMELLKRYVTIIRDTVLRHNECGHEMEANLDLNPTTEVWVILDKPINLSDANFIISSTEVVYAVFQGYCNGPVIK